MATIKLSVLKSKPLKDGRYKIRIAVSHRTQTCYITTRFSVSSPTHFKNGSVIKEADSAITNKKLRGLLDTYQDRLDSIRSINLYSCRELTNIIENGAFADEAASFSMASSMFADSLQRENRTKYMGMVVRSCRYFSEYTDDIRLDAVTPTIINNFATFLRSRTREAQENGRRVLVRCMSEASVGTTLAHVKAVINMAIENELVSYKTHPFAKTKIASTKPREADISISSFRKILEYRPDIRKLQVARDVFLLSFYFGGINLTDLMDIRFKDATEICFTRKKTEHRTSNPVQTILPVTDKAREIIDRYMDVKTGALDFGYSFSFHNFSCYISRNLKKIKEALEIPEPLSYMSARKTFSQFALELGIPDNVIDYCQSHSDAKRGVARYYSKIKQQQAAIAITKVIEYTENPDAYDDIINMNESILMAKL